MAHRNHLKPINLSPHRTRSPTIFQFPMRVYLDNCCYNRPFDEQDQLSVRLETMAKLAVQLLMATGGVEYAWSDILTLEVSHNPSRQRRQRIMAWRQGAVVDVISDNAVLARGRTFQTLGVKPKDALHLASAIEAGCDWFLTTDRGILKKVSEIGEMRVANPTNYIMTEDAHGH